MDKILLQPDETLLAPPVADASSVAPPIEAHDLEGKIVLVGIARIADDGSIDRKQFAGSAHIESQGDYNVVCLACTDGVERTYPFDARAVGRASDGEYRLRATGEVVTNPDFLMTWTITKDENET